MSCRWAHHQGRHARVPVPSPRAGRKDVVVTQVLVVDAERPLLRSLVMNLVARNYDVIAVSTAAAALTEVAAAAPHVLLLELDLPDLDGMEVIRRLQRTHPRLPLIVVSARAQTQDKVAALELGATDYVTKPFDMSELIARLRAAVRNSARQSPATTLVRFGNRTVDLEARSVFGEDGARIHLTGTEWRMLHMLVRQPGRAVSAAELLTAVRANGDQASSNFVRVYIAKLRAKLEPEPRRPRHLVTDVGVGYRFDPTPQR